MTEEIKDLFEQRRLVKQDQVQYNLVNKQILRRCAKAKEVWLERECQKVELHVSNPRKMFQKNQEDS